MYKFDLKYSELDLLIEDLKYRCRIDLNSFSKSPLKRIVGGFMDENSIVGINALSDLLLTNERQKDAFLRCLIPNKTEFFRDPGVWRYLEQELPKLVKKSGSFKVLDLGCSSGEELLTFSILREELGLQDKIELIGSEKYQLKLDDINKAEFSIKSLESCENNYNRFKADAKFSQFIKVEGETFKLDPKYLKNVSTQVYDMTIGRAFGEFDIVFCRNVMCYLNLKKARPVYKLLSDFTKKGGLLFMGVQEDLTHSFYSRDFNCINEEYKIYEKIK